MKYDPDLYLQHIDGRGGGEVLKYNVFIMIAIDILIIKYNTQIDRQKYVYVDRQI